MDGRDTIMRSSSVLTAEVDGQAVMMDAVRGAYYGLDVIGSDIWQRLAEPILVDDLLAGLIRDYDADPAVIISDVQDLLSSMAERGMVVVQP